MPRGSDAERAGATGPEADPAWTRRPAPARWRSILKALFALRAASASQRLRPRRRRPWPPPLAAVLLGLSASPALASPAALCDVAAEAAAARWGVPAAVMRALTRTETGRSRGGRLEPWPWTVNMEGEGRWFDDPREALAYVEAKRAQGARSFDIGCFQVNHLWHGEHFASVETMFDPHANADYAARFLAGLYAEAGDWTVAAGRYHSRTPEFFERYRDRFLAILAREGEGARLAAGPAQEGGAAPTEIPPILWKSADPAVAPSPGAVAIRLNRGAASPLRAARGPLFIAAPARRTTEAALARVAADEGGRAFP